MPGDFEFLNSRIRTRQRQSGPGWSGRTHAAARAGRAPENAFFCKKMEFLSIMFMWVDSILDANRCASRKSVEIARRKLRDSG